MKKFLLILIVTFLFSNTGSSKISKIYYDELFDSCMLEAVKANLGYETTKNYCKCSADHFDTNYDDTSLINLVQGEGGSAYNDVVNFVISKCRSLVGLD